MSQTHSVIEEALAEALPAAVAAQLVDLGRACNAASLAYRQALLSEVQAGQALDAIRDDDPAVQFRRFAADAQADTALDAADQSLATYAVLTGTYATFATTVLAAAVAGTLIAVDPVKPITPSQLLANPDGVLATAELPPGIADEDVRERLEEARHRVALAASNARASGVAVCYDGRAAAAARPRGAVDLSEDVPDGLHAYAAVLLEVLDLLVVEPGA